MKKRGQVTIFIIIAILVIGAVALFFTLRGEVSIGKKELAPAEVAPISNYVQECIGTVTTQGIYSLGIQGGYYNTPDPKETYLLSEIPIYWNVDSENIPARETIELELNEYVLDNLSECLNNFQEFEKQGFAIENKKAPSGEVVIGNKIRFKLNYPLIIEKGDSRSKVEDFSYILDFDFITKYNIARSIINEQKNNPGMFAIGYIGTLAYENEFIFETINLENKEVIVSLIFNEFDEEGYPFVYSFIIKYGEEE